MCRHSTILCLIAAAILVFPNRALADLVIDQQQTTRQGNNNVGRYIGSFDLKYVQTFRVGRAGVLAGVDLWAYFFGNDPDLTVSIVELDATGLPDESKVLGSKTLSGPGLVGLPAQNWFFDLSASNIRVNVGQQLGIHVSSTDYPHVTGDVSVVFWGSGNVYADGVEYRPWNTTTGQLCGWCTTAPMTDMYFRTWVDENAPPTADAGSNQSVHAGQTVGLGGLGSSDDTTPSEDLLYMWNFALIPESSVARLNGSNTATPSFVADAVGDYVVSLVVSDSGGVSSAPDYVTISTLNTPPNAIAGNAQGTYVGNVVAFDGSASNDPDLDPLTFSWSVAVRPAGSAATLSSAISVNPTLIPDLAGTYVVELVVNDRFTNSAPSQVAISVATVSDFTQAQMVDALNQLGVLPASAVTTAGNRNALSNFLTQVLDAQHNGDFVTARKKLVDALERTDGCALREAPDTTGQGQIKGDYINNCSDQSGVYRVLKMALDALDQDL